MTGKTKQAKTRSTGERFRVVLVSPEYESNIGAVARAMKNFGFSDLRIVAPKCDPRGYDAIMYSKHARELLESAKIFKSTREATRGCRLTVGTTGVLFRHWNETIRSPMLLRQLSQKLAANKEGKIALLFGGEGVGLSEEEISACDFLVTIPTSSKYPILNLSHAVAIVLYELSALQVKTFEPAGENEKEALIRTFSLMADQFAHEMRNPRKTKIAFRRMVGKSMLTDKECASILGVLRRSLREMEKK